MGCWNQTCVVTRTAIRNGEACRLVVLASVDRYQGAICNAQDRYRPVDVPFKGTYDDDEAFIKITDPDELARFNKVMGDLGFAVGVDWCEYRNAMSGQVPFVFGRYEISYCLISETVFECMRDQYLELKNDLRDHYWPQYLGEIEILKQGASDPADSMYLKVLADSPSMLIEWGVQHFPKDHYREQTLRFLNWGVGSRRTKLHWIFPEFADANDVFARLLALAELWLVHDFLDDIRGYWCPQGGQGSQDNNDRGQYNRLISMIEERIFSDNA
ncbi:MAG: hypothetical protein RSD49_18020 [Hafnia sp.]